MDSFNQLFVPRSDHSIPSHQIKENQMPSKTLQRLNRKPQTKNYLPSCAKSPMKTNNQDLQLEPQEYLHYPHEILPNKQKTSEPIAPASQLPLNEQTHQNKGNQERQSANGQLFSIFSHLKSEQGPSKSSHISQSVSSQNASDEYSMIDPDQFLTSFNKKLTNHCEEGSQSPLREKFDTKDQEQQKNKVIFFSREQQILQDFIQRQSDKIKTCQQQLIPTPNHNILKSSRQYCFDLEHQCNHLQNPIEQSKSTQSLEEDNNSLRFTNSDYEGHDQLGNFQELMRIQQEDSELEQSLPHLSIFRKNSNSQTLIEDLSGLADERIRETSQKQSHSPLCTLQKQVTQNEIPFQKAQFCQNQVQLPMIVLGNQNILDSYHQENQKFLSEDQKFSHSLESQLINGDVELKTQQSGYTVTVEDEITCSEPDFNESCDRQSLQNLSLNYQTHKNIRLNLKNPVKQFSNLQAKQKKLKQYGQKQGKRSHSKSVGNGNKIEKFGRLFSSQVSRLDELVIIILQMKKQFQQNYLNAINFETDQCSKRASTIMKKLKSIEYQLKKNAAINQNQTITNPSQIQAQRLTPIYSFHPEQQQQNYFITSSKQKDLDSKELKNESLKCETFRHNRKDRLLSRSALDTLVKGLAQRESQQINLSQKTKTHGHQNFKHLKYESEKVIHNHRQSVDPSFRASEEDILLKQIELNFNSNRIKRKRIKNQVPFPNTQVNNQQPPYFLQSFPYVPTVINNMQQLDSAKARLEQQTINQRIKSNQESNQCSSKQILPSLKSKKDFWLTKQLIKKADVYNPVNNKVRDSFWNSKNECGKNSKSIEKNENSACSIGNQSNCQKESTQQKQILLESASLDYRFQAIRTLSYETHPNQSKFSNPFNFQTDQNNFRKLPGSSINKISKQLDEIDPPLPASELQESAGQALHAQVNIEKSIDQKIQKSIQTFTNLPIRFNKKVKQPNASRSWTTKTIYLNQSNLTKRTNQQIQQNSSENNSKICQMSFSNKQICSSLGRASEGIDLDWVLNKKRLIEILPSSPIFNSIYYQKKDKEVYKYKWFQIK